MNFTSALIFIVKYSYENQVTQSSSFSSQFGDPLRQRGPSMKAGVLPSLLLVLSTLFFFFPSSTPFHCEVENHNTV